MIDRLPSAQDLIDGVKTAWRQPVMRRSILFGAGMGAIAFILVIILLSVTLPDVGQDKTPLPSVVLQIDRPDDEEITQSMPNQPTIDESAGLEKPEKAADIPDSAETMADAPPAPPAPIRRDRVIITRAGDDLDIRQFPAGLALAYFPDAVPDRRQRSQIKQNGQAILLHLPMEPADFPSSNPGPDAIMTNRSPADNVARLRDMLGLADWDGILIYQGGAVLRDGEQLGALLPVIGSKNLPVYLSKAQQTDTLTRMARGYDISIQTVEQSIHPTDDPAEISALIARALQPDALITIQLPGHPIIMKRIDIPGPIRDNI